MTIVIRRRDDPSYRGDMLSPHLPIKDVIAAHPETRAIFAKHGLDTCCGGAHPIEMAARTKNLDLELLMAELESAAAPKKIGPRASVRDVIAQWPWTVGVFERHGLTGCGGGQGPDEPLGFFATVHEVDPEKLMTELETAIAAGPPREAAAPFAAPEADVYPPFIKGAIVATLTGGATLGLVALTIAGLRGSLSTGLAWWTPVIQAHGHVQIFGWVALFIMGVAYHVVPRFKATDLYRPDLARRTFWLMAGGLTARALAQPYTREAFASVVGVAGAAAELVAVALFARIIAHTIASSPGPRAGFERYLFAGNVWFLVLAAANLGSMIRMAATGDPVIPAPLNGALIHAEVVGFIGLWILGVSLRILPVFLGLRALGTLAARGVFWAVNLAVALAAGAEILGVTALRVPAALLELGAVAVFVIGLGVFRKPASSAHADPNPYYRKFIVAAYAWLVFAAALLAFISVYEAAVAPLPHELTGSYRHAITVGFITAMIMGVASRVVPVFRGVPLQGVGAVNAAFWLLNAGCAIRVVFQAVAGFRGAPFTLISSSSAYLEIPAIALFSLVLWRTLDARLVAGAATDEITLESRVGTLIDKRPELLAVFLRHGFAPLANPVLRRAMGAVVTVRQACGLHGVDPEALLHDLRAEAAPAVTGHRAVPLRVIS
jgi:uncharacterized protein DUF1858/uncharacterized protein DUF542/NnrS protein